MSEQKLLLRILSRDRKEFSSSAAINTNSVAAEARVRTRRLTKHLLRSAHQTWHILVDKTRLWNFVETYPPPPIKATVSSMRLQHAAAPTMQTSTLRAAGTVPNRSTPKEMGKQDVRSLLDITAGLQMGKLKPNLYPPV